VGGVVGHGRARGRLRLRLACGVGGHGGVSSSLEAVAALSAVWGAASVPDSIAADVRIGCGGAVRRGCRPSRADSICGESRRCRLVAHIPGFAHRSPPRRAETGRESVRTARRVHFRLPKRVYSLRWTGGPQAPVRTRRHRGGQFRRPDEMSAVAAWRRGRIAAAAGPQAKSRPAVSEEVRVNSAEGAHVARGSDQAGPFTTCIAWAMPRSSSARWADSPTSRSASRSSRS